LTAHLKVETDGRGGATMILPGYEAGSAGAQPCPGITGGRIDAVKIPRPMVEYSLTESALFPFQAEPTHTKPVEYETVFVMLPTNASPVH
jgi:hypothetical protein